MRKSVSKDKIQNSARGTSKKDLVFHVKNSLNLNSSRNRLPHPATQIAEVCAQTDHGKRNRSHTANALLM